MELPREHLITWLRDAYVMEQKAIELCSRQAERLETYPEMQERIEIHLDETRAQAEKLKACLALLGSEPSDVKNAVGKMVANMRAFMTTLAEDEVVKDGIASYTFEHFEIICYKSLIAAAEQANEPEIARICKEILAEEEAMAEWLDTHIKDTTVAYLMRDAADMHAKH